MLINVTILASEVGGGAGCFDVLEEPTILVSLVLNIALGKCAANECKNLKVLMSAAHTQKVT